MIIFDVIFKMNLNREIGDEGELPDPKSRTEDVPLLTVRG